ncbi:superoxide dismutase [Blattabacterium cuenoti]|uniref:superoxide dismutase n=1 Tax=Blattabacterium cuenoti TaxID=1653831 RepID=UPI00163C8B4F|nr:superoxide dismutase [Blattabacterium cuenoti]
MSFTLPKLNFAYDELEPYIDTKTMEIHHKKHHAGYTNNLNNAIFQTDMENMSIEKILRRSNIEDHKIKNNSGGYYNHNFFWKILIPNKKMTDPSEYLIKIINNSFQSFNIFKKEFSSIAINHFGSGWAWLCVNNNNNKLTIISTNNQDNPLMLGIEHDHAGYPILGLDLWEHAYYLQYQNRRIDYISSFWNIINWKQVETNYKQYIK